MGQRKSFIAFKMSGHHAASKAPLTPRLTNATICPLVRLSSVKSFAAIAASLVIFVVKSQNDADSASRSCTESALVSSLTLSQVPSLRRLGGLLAGIWTHRSSLLSPVLLGG